ncbi:tRNA/rRNA methylase SpoU [Mycobacterium bohemicum DSM 44277]|jgi:tRNA (cytidine/uridine-2'-O-)-methyltransferase|nr:tRNA/rRNA methylase SpoU [Mycobacterium bohemicum DSM 44277]
MWQFHEYDSPALGSPESLLSRDSSVGRGVCERGRHGKHRGAFCHDRQMFRLLFFSPRIPPNTGNAIRTAAATGCELHLVEPLGFDLSEPQLRRAGLDYHDLASVTVHASLPAAWQALLPARVFAFTAQASSRFADIGYRPGDVLMFGPEPDGLDAETLADPNVTQQVRIPMLAGRRSLNLSNAAAIAVYEAWRQQGYPGAV